MLNVVIFDPWQRSLFFRQRTPGKEPLLAGKVIHACEWPLKPNPPDLRACSHGGGGPQVGEVPHLPVVKERQPSHAIIRSLRNHDGDAEDTSIKKRVYILPTNLAILLSHLLCLSLSKLSRN